ncbi:MAG: ROK family protein [Eubacteriaceae bacterium]|jgi:glucokinase
MKIGIDVGGTNLAAGVVDSKGDIVHKISTPAEVEKGYQSMLDKLTALSEELIAWTKENKPGDPVTEIGAGIPGIISKDGSTVVSAPNIFWKNESLQKDLSEKTGLPVYLSNDATVAGIAENVFGSTRGFEDAFMYTLGTGVGGCVIVNGKTVSGTHGCASEVGHTLCGPNFYTCNCGKNGCLETYASATGLIKRAQKLIGDGRESSISAMADGDLSKINAKMVIDAAKAGDSVGLECFDILVDKMTDSIANVIDILDPGVFTIGGGVANAGDFLLDALREKMTGKLTYPELEQPDIRLASLGNDAGIIGAAYIGDYASGK